MLKAGLNDTIVAISTPIGEGGIGIVRISGSDSLSIAKKMLNHSRFYGGFMPCRVLYVEYGDGRRYLISMDMTLALYGGTDKKPINPELMEDMKNVKKAMEEIPSIAACYYIEKAEKKD